MSKKFKVGQKLYTKGLDMRCQPTVEEVIFLGYKNDHKVFDCTIESDGIAMYDRTDSLYETAAEVKL